MNEDPNRVWEKRVGYKYISMGSDVGHCSQCGHDFWRFRAPQPYNKNPCPRDVCPKCWKLYQMQQQQPHV